MLVGVSYDCIGGCGSWRNKDGIVATVYKTTTEDARQLKQSIVDGSQVARQSPSDVNSSGTTVFHIQTSRRPPPGTTHTHTTASITTIIASSQSKENSATHQRQYSYGQAIAGFPSVGFFRWSTTFATKTVVADRGTVERSFGWCMHRESASLLEFIRSFVRSFVRSFFNNMSSKQQNQSSTQERAVSYTHLTLPTIYSV